MALEKQTVSADVSAAAADVVAADSYAARALLAVDDDVDSQLTALQALAALVEKTRAASPEGVLWREARRLLEERKGAMRAWHRDVVERALARYAAAGDVARDDAVRALESALRFLGAVDGGDGDGGGGGGELRTLRAKLDEVKRGRPAKPRPFFARYLEHQKRIGAGGAQER